MKPILPFILAATVLSATADCSAQKRHAANRRTGHGGKGIGRGPQYGNSPAARSLRAMQSRGIIGKRRPIPVDPRRRHNEEYRAEAVRQRKALNAANVAGFTKPPTP